MSAPISVVTGTGVQVRFDDWVGFEDYVADVMAQAWIEGRNAGLEDARLSDEDNIPAVTFNPYIPTDEWTFGL